MACERSKPNQHFERAMGIEPIAHVRPINQILLIRLPLHT